MRSNPSTALLFAGLLVGACTSAADVPTAPDATQITDVSPPGGSIDVSVGTTVTVAFSRPMPVSTAQYVALHMGTVNGPAVTGSVSWSTDGMRMTFQPDLPLAAHSVYTLHVGGGLMDDDDRPVDYSWCPLFGGQPVTGGMMGGAMGSMMDAGWRDAAGGYGVMFAFTTS